MERRPVAQNGGDAAERGAASHYYAARETNAWPLVSGGETEKLLFYRGIADVPVDLHAVVHTGGVSVGNEGSESISLAIVFENHGGKIAYRVIHGLREPVEVAFSSLAGSTESLRRQFEDSLTEMGLYREEARAMLATWRDSWFEEGLRVFYLLPRAKVDALLPVSIQPAPAQLARVFVGRVELLAPWMRTEIGAALTSGDGAVLERYGRFLSAFLAEMGNPPMSEQARAVLADSEAKIDVESRRAACGH